KAGEDISALIAQAGGGASAPAAAPAPAAEKPTAPAPAPAAAAAAVETPQAAQAPVPPPVSAPREKGSLLDRTQREGHGRSRAHAPAGRIFASPYVRRAARERGIDLQGAQGSGPGGRVVAKDLDTMSTRPAAPAGQAGLNGHAAPAVPAGA